MKPLIVSDWYCGGGGSSTGMRRFFERAGVPIKRFVAVNHDKDAIETHSWNHPEVVHYCRNVETVDLRSAFPEGYCDFAWASPSCVMHSRAYGGRPINDQLRTGPWQLLEIANQIYVKRWAVENVPEIADWAPLGANGRPLAAKRGETFNAWISAFEAHGYRVEWRILNAADFGGATTRERFILLARRDGRRISWPVPTHSRDGSPTLFEGARLPWRGAREILDRSIASKPIVGRRQPLAAPTLARAAHGVRSIWGASAARIYLRDVLDAAREGLAYNLDKLPQVKRDLLAARTNDARMKYRKSIARLEKGVERYRALIVDLDAYLTSPSLRGRSALAPFLVNLRGTGPSQIAQSASKGGDPAPSITAGGGHLGVAEATLELVGANRAHNVPRPTHEPAAAVTTATGGGLFLVTPIAEALVVGQHGGGVVRAASSPMSTLTGAGAVGLVTPEAEPIVLTYERETDGAVARPRPVSEPLASVLTRDHFGVCEAILTPYYGEKDGRPRSSRGAGDPLATASTENRFGVVEGIIVPASSSGVARDIGTPVNSLTTTQRGVGVCEGVLVTVNHEGAESASRVRDLNEPMPPPTTKNGLGVCEPYLVAHFGEAEGQTPRVHSTDEPFPSVTHRGAGDLVEAALEGVEDLDPALRDRLLVGEDGRLYVGRLHFRMLDPHRELAPTMGFPADYVWPQKKSVVTRLVGNAVHVDLADAVTSALLADLVPATKAAPEVGAA